ncbi:MAG: 2-oxoglutarate dehydrogenase E1 component, partial [Desulfobacterales bacterium]
MHLIYADQLIADNVIQPGDPDAIANEINTRLETAYDAVHGSECPFPVPAFYENWNDIKADFSPAPVATGVKKETLLALAQKLNSVPQDFALNPKLERLLQKRLKSAESGQGLDWSGAEALAFASLLTEGFPVRLSGQDSGRGTFSQRHSILVDIQSGKNYAPLNALDKQQASFRVYNSLLSEAGVLGFEYGYSLAQPYGLVIWEAQFGDFVN